MKTLPGDIYVGGQLLPQQLAELAEQGVRTIINNRPDGEIAGQPSSADMAQAAQAAGLAYHHIGLSGAAIKSGISPDILAASVEAYRQSERPIAAFCASGTRVALLWCYAHVSALGVEAVLAAAHQAGYELEPFRESLSAFAKIGC